MNYNNPKDKEFIEKLVQEYIDLQDQKGEGLFAIIYNQERLKEQFEKFINQSKKEIKRVAQKYKEETGKELTIYNCFDHFPYVTLYDKILPLNPKIEFESRILSEEEIINYQRRYLTAIEYTLIHRVPGSKLIEYSLKKERADKQRIPSVEELLKGTYNHDKEHTIAKESQ